MKAALLLALSFFVCSSIALAAGDPPRTLNAQQAQALFNNYYRPLLGLGCPGKEVPVSATIEGGDSPEGGSQFTNFQFKNGITMTVVTSWGKLLTSGEARNSTTVTIKCSLNK